MWPAQLLPLLLEAGPHQQPVRRPLRGWDQQHSSRLQTRHALQATQPTPFQAGRLQEAEGLYGHSLDHCPTAAAHLNRALVSLRLRRPQAAAQDCAEALRLEPLSAKAHHRMALALDMLGRPEQALGHMEALAGGLSGHGPGVPAWAASQLTAADSAAMAGEHAEIAARAALRWAPSPPEPWQVRGHSRLVNQLLGELLAGQLLPRRRRPANEAGGSGASARSHAAPGSSGSGGGGIYATAQHVAGQLPQPLIEGPATPERQEPSASDAAAGGGQQQTPQVRSPPPQHEPLAKGAPPRLQPALLLGFACWNLDCKHMGRRGEHLVPTQACGGCGLARYCSAACAQQHRPLHRAQCCKWALQLGRRAAPQSCKS